LAAAMLDQDKIKRGDTKEMTSREKRMAQIGDVTLFDYINYMLVLPTSFSGPQVEYFDANEFLNCRSDAKMRSHSHILPGLVRFLQAVSALGLLTVLLEYFDTQWMFTEEFGQKNIVFKTFHLIVCMNLIIIKLMYVFGTVEACLILSGLGYRAEHLNDKGVKVAENYNSI
jgi:D-alanyl-lipoteichoic acid acyltransferase DltB (MBOAT superfamily)